MRAVPLGPGSRDCGTKTRLIFGKKARARPEPRLCCRKELSTAIATAPFMKCFRMATFHVAMAPVVAVMATNVHMEARNPEAHVCMGLRHGGNGNCAKGDARG
jgi:hypothetical protein